jgi:hypothetical protein
MPWLTEIPCCLSPVKQVSNWCSGIRSRTPQTRRHEGYHPAQPCIEASISQSRHTQGILRTVSGYALFGFAQAGSSGTMRHRASLW